jgi:hypothetical protein
MPLRIDFTAIKFLSALCFLLFCNELGAADRSKAANAQKVRYTNTVPPTGGKNLVPNGSFEAGCAGWSSLGRGVGYENVWMPLGANWGNLAALHGTVENSGGSDGRSFLRIRLGGENTPVFNFDCFDPVNRRELRPLAANIGWIEVTAGQPYTISLDMRASRDGVPAAFGAQNEDPSQGWCSAQEQILEPVALTTTWKRYSHTFVPKYPFLFVLAGPNLTQEGNVAVDVDAVQLEKGERATAFTPRRTVEIGVVATAPCGVFTVGQSGGLKVTACNNADAPSQAEVRFRATDYYDKPVELPAVAFEVPAKSTVERLVALPDAWRGFYRVTAVCKVGQAEETRLLRVAVVPPRTTTETVIGVNHAYPTKSLVELAKKAGVSWYRDWSLMWQHIEPTRGDRRWDVSDPQIKRVSEQGARLMAVIPFPSTDWNSTAPSLETLKALAPCYRRGGQGDESELISRARWAWVPRDTNELTDFIKAAVSRYKDDVQVWEFLNEPLFTSYSLPDASVLGTRAIKAYTVQDYIDLTRAVVPAIRAANPKARIMGGPGMEPGGKYTVAMIEGGLLKLIDIFGIHDYPDWPKRTKPELRLKSSDRMLAAMKTHGGPKPIWLTEFSYFGTDDLPRHPFKPVPGLWSEPLLHSEKEVADYTIRYCTIFLGRGGERIFLHSGCTGSVNKPGTESCLFADGAVRKVFPAMAVFTELMGGRPKFIADRTKGGGIVFAFETEKQAVLVLWDPGEKTTAGIPQDATCLDITGRKMTGSTVRLNGSPVYFIGPAGAAKRLFEECSETIHAAEEKSGTGQTPI